MTGKHRPMLRVNRRACTGCRACTIVCALVHEHQLGLNRSRIRVEKSLPELKLPAFRPAFCRMCADPACVSVCAPEALFRDGDSGLVHLEVDQCDGCGLCVEACPFGAIWMDEQRRVALKCDLCGGDPYCVTYCAPKALRFD